MDPQTVAIWVGARLVGSHWGGYGRETMDLVDHIIAALPQMGGWWAVFLLALGAATRVDWSPSDRTRAGGWWLLLGGGCAWAIYSALQRLWLSDDAYISFRYARNLVEGHGLVFNPGEWVEGYTNFLWTVAIAGLGALGVDMPMAGLFGGFVALVALLWLVARTVRHASTDSAPDAPARPVVPFAALSLAGAVGFCTFAGGGLETMPAACLVVLGVYAITRGWPTWAGLAFVLAAMTRPDHLLMWGCMGLALAAEDLRYPAPDEGPSPWFRRLWGRLQWRRYARFTAPLLLVYLPYFLIRWRVYGDVFPNTYYAKSGGSSYYSQGWIYLQYWLTGSGAWLWLPALAIAMLGRAGGRAEWRLRMFAVLAIAIYGHYVVRVGGDFMQDRFFIVLWPIAAMAFEVSVRARLTGSTRRRRAVWLTLSAAALAAAVTPVDPIGRGRMSDGLAQEYSYYTVLSLDPLKVNSHLFRRATNLARAFDDPSFRPRIAVHNVGYVGYFTNLPIVDTLGLTNRRIGRKTLTERGRPGHEKRATLEEVLAEGAVVATEPFHAKRWREYVSVWLGKYTRVYLLQEDPALRAALGRLEGARGLRPLDGLVQRAERVHPGEARVILRFLERFAPEARADDIARLRAGLR